MRRLLAAGALLAVLAGCAGPRNALNTSASPCFRGLPLASAAVGPKAKVLGVRIVRRSELVRNLPQAGRVDAESMCAIAYSGTFVRGDVPAADPPGPGRYAIVALDTKGSRVLATFVVDALPVRFRHRV
ncbi:MAG TPA: hypothetical protein VHT97_15320 [Acidimicrobiales bacterium]|nr:hypothetical protein [Acidimicrobiales bacterium]